MASAAARGKRHQYQVHSGIRDAGFDVEIPNVAGAAKDQGDHAIRLDTPGSRQLPDPDYLVIKLTDPGSTSLPDPQRVVGESKNQKAMQLTRYVKEALAEADNYAASRGIPRMDVQGVAFVKVRGKGWKDALVVTTVREYLGLED